MYAALAQSVERLTRNEKVNGSIPLGGSTPNSPCVMGSRLWTTASRGRDLRIFHLCQGFPLAFTDMLVVGVYAIHTRWQAIDVTQRSST